ncbi:MAG: phosphoenolpyruvate mutase [Clostridiales bacterium]|jgi:phosphoenolpyruvate phosphomutase|nr:phosphoenolpyruvate mutase [Clostridiales bacterium]
MKTVFMSFSTDIIHGGHIAIIQKAAALGQLTVGILTDEAVATYKRFPLLPLTDRMNIFRNISGISAVVQQHDIAGVENIRQLQPDYVVHGDDWQSDFRSSARADVIAVLSGYGGELVEYAYSDSPVYTKLEKQAYSQLSIPDIRRGRLKKLLALKPLVNAIEAHSGLTGLIAENTKVSHDGKVSQFDAMWLSSLCDSTMKGKPDIEVVDFSSRLRTIEDILEVTTKPLIFDADTGGLPEHFAFLMRTLERVGVSAAIVEDKVGLKRNSLFGTGVEQKQDSIENFCAKIQTGKSALKTRGTMIIARIESLILETGMDDALRRANAYVEAGADGIMIHSRKKTPDEIFEFCGRFRESCPTVPLATVPTAYSSVRESELAKNGVNIVIYANHLIRSAFPAMKSVAESILTNGRAYEADNLCLPISEIITLIPEQ